MASKTSLSDPSPLNESAKLEEEEIREPKTVPVYEINGDLYQQFRKPGGDQWDMSLIWERHTVSSKAKDWGLKRARQSRPIPALYKRGRTFEAVPAFKQYDKEELKAVINRVQRPTKSAMLRTTRRGEDDSSEETSSSKPAESETAASEQKVLIERLLRPTASQSRRVELTLKYRPPAAAAVRQS